MSSFELSSNPLVFICVSIVLVWGNFVCLVRSSFEEKINRKLWIFCQSSLFSLSFLLLIKVSDWQLMFFKCQLDFDLYFKIFIMIQGFYLDEGLNMGINLMDSMCWTGPLACLSLFSVMFWKRVSTSIYNLSLPNLVSQIKTSLAESTVGGPPLVCFELV